MKMICNCCDRIKEVVVRSCRGKIMYGTQGDVCKNCCILINLGDKETYNKIKTCGAKK